MSRRHPNPGGLRVDLVIDAPDLAARVREEANRSGSSFSEVIRASLTGTLPVGPQARTTSEVQPSVSLHEPEPLGPRPEELPTAELRALVGDALQAWAAEEDPVRKAQLQREHHRMARVLGSRVRASRTAAAT